MTAVRVVLVGAAGLSIGWLFGRATASQLPSVGPDSLTATHGPSAEGPKLVGARQSAAEAELLAVIDGLRARIRELEAQREHGAQSEAAGTSAVKGREARLAAYQKAAEALAIAEADLRPEDSYRPFPAQAPIDASYLPEWGTPSRVHGILAEEDVATYRRWILARASNYTLSALPPATDPQTRGRIEAHVHEWIGEELSLMLGARQQWAALSPRARSAAVEAYLREAHTRRVQAAGRVQSELEQALGREARYLRVDLLP